jgi:hypothetical protein
MGASAEGEAMALAALLAGDAAADEDLALLGRIATRGAGPDAIAGGELAEEGVDTRLGDARFGAAVAAAEVDDGDDALLCEMRDADGSPMVSIGEKCHKTAAIRPLTGRLS